MYVHYRVIIIVSGICKICDSETVLELQRMTVSQNDADCDNLPTTNNGGIIQFYEVDIPWKKSKAGVGVNDKAAAKARLQELVRNHSTGLGKGKGRKNS